jgi:hypothetical protein
LSRLYVTFVDKEGDEHKIAVSKGNNLLEIAQAHDIEMEGKFAQPYTHFSKANKQIRSLRRILLVLNMPCYSRRRGNV